MLYCINLDISFNPRGDTKALQMEYTLFFN